MKMRTACLLLLAAVATNFAEAQNPDKKVNSDVQIINFGSESESSKTDKVYKGLIVKTSPTSFIFGRQPVEIEKEITDYLSLQVGVGLTFSPFWDGYNELLAELSDEEDIAEISDQWAYDVQDNYSDYSIRTGSIGPILSLSPRLFFESDGYEGFYVAPVLRYSIQHYRVQKIREGLPHIEHTPDETQKESIKNLDLMVHWGAQKLYPKLTLEWFIGGGVRLRNNTRQDVGFDFTMLSGNGEQSFKDKRFRFETGVRIGFQL
ncbi:MAG: hypothetical protein IPM98_01570 [Lewinellaceae bacterium]|nr:hypothetical protein [Lewinellaceae bacterium]